MEISISGLEISGACPKCGKPDKFSLTLTIARDLTTRNWNVGCAWLVCGLCKYKKEFPPPEKDCTYALRLLAIVGEDLELSLYSVFVALTLAEKLRILEERA